MNLVVQKYGGTSVADAERLRHVAGRVARRREEGAALVVVVSAMGRTTDALLALARQVTSRPEEREMDLLLATGEVVSCTLLAMALREQGVPARSFTGAQAGIFTDETHGRARIVRIKPGRLRETLDRGEVAIVAGFQGMTARTDITTLGRGGSDTTAVALAAALQAPVCEIYTDVEGVFTCDPRLEPRARRLAELSYEEMLELASQGARVMHPRAVELGAVYNIPILVASSFKEAPGTLIHRINTMEPTDRVRAISHDTDVAKITALGLPDRPGVAARLFEAVAAAHVMVDAIVQNTSVHLPETDLTFTVPKGDLARAVAAAEAVLPEVGARGLQTDEAVGKVSIVGTGVLNSPGHAARMFQALSRAGINIQLITTSEIRITCVVDHESVSRAVRALHEAFELERPEALGS